MREETRKYEEFDNKLSLENTGINSLNIMLDSLIKKYERNPGDEKANGLISTSCIEAEFIKIID